MALNIFLDKFKFQLLDEENTVISGNVKFRELSSWDSLSAMAIIIMIEDDYNVKITNDIFKTLITIDDIYNYILKNCNK
jgi:acyl carrier protein